MNEHSISTKESIALHAIVSYIEDGVVSDVYEADLPSTLCKKGACFVTVYVKGELRGCIGSSKAFEPLYRNIIRNAISASAQDYRFPAITKDDLTDMSVEVSVLTPLKRHYPRHSQDLLAYLQMNKPGLMLEQEGRQALFLPQVWKELPDPSDFLSHLCMKAGLNGSAWKNRGMKFWIFTVKS